MRTDITQYNDKDYLIVLLDKPNRSKNEYISWLVKHRLIEDISDVVVAKDAISYQSIDRPAKVILLIKIGVAFIYEPRIRGRSIKKGKLPESLVAELDQDDITIRQSEVYTFGKYQLQSKRAFANKIEKDWAETSFLAEASGHLPMSWNLETIGIPSQSYQGQGIRVAVLDSGLDTDHDDFKGRANIVTLSFHDKEKMSNDCDHGMRCAGILGAPKTPQWGPRYGIAPCTKLYVGKVMKDQTMHVSDLRVLAGIDWALRQQCEIISLSLFLEGGNKADVKDGYSQVFNKVGGRALAQNALIVAAAGNSKQNEHRNKVLHPANCPNILAVAALGRTVLTTQHETYCKAQDAAVLDNGSHDLGVWRSSNTCLAADDVAAPGVHIYSSQHNKNPDFGDRRYGCASGTSMAAPHVAGIAALWAQACGLRGQALRDRVVQSCDSRGLHPDDVGAGLVQAPQ